jgi:hypothetical protein
MRRAAWGFLRSVEIDGVPSSGRFAPTFSRTREKGFRGTGEAPRPLAGEGLG